MNTIKDSYFENNGWSSELFFKHAQVILPVLEKRYKLEYDRHWIKLYKNNKHIATIWVHYNGRSNENMTVTNCDGQEVRTYHYSLSTEKLLERLLGVFITLE